MKDYIILADITCDLSEDIRREIGMTDYLPGHVTIDDGRDLPTTLDWSNISREEFYKILGNKKRKVTSAPPNIDEYYACFEKYVKQGIAVVSLSLSSKISATFSFADTAVKRIKENYPDAQIYSIDTMRMSSAFGLIVVYAHLLKKQGKTVEEVIAWIEENKNRVHQMGPIDDLLFVARRGRITMGKAIMGNIVGVKPMADCNAEGYVTVLAKSKGISKAMDATVKYVGLTARDVENQTFIVAHSDRQLYAEKLRDMLAEKFPAAKIYVTDVFSGAGTNIGPGMLAVYYLGDPILEGMEAEKEAMAQVMAK